MTQSMTGFATANGQIGNWEWVWDIRSVNGRGLDLRLRLPDWIEGLEPQVRDATKKSIARGSVTIGLKLVKSDAPNDASLIDPATMKIALKSIEDVELAAQAAGVALTPTNANDVIALCRSMGHHNIKPSASDIEELRTALVNDVPKLMDAFNASRAAEGLSLNQILSGQVNKIQELVEAAKAVLGARSDAVEANFKANLARIMDGVDVDSDRVAQELAVLAVKSDVTEEIDRLEAHVVAARDLLGSDGPVGRKLDFLTQEFNREANTLCSKAQFEELTRIGLDLKAVIDQMREQVQNVE